MANITPVAAFRAGLEKADGVQCTLTKWVRNTKECNLHTLITVPSTPPTLTPLTPSLPPPTPTTKLLPVANLAQWGLKGIETSDDESFESQPRVRKRDITQVYPADTVVTKPHLVSIPHPVAKTHHVTNLQPIETPGIYHPVDTPETGDVVMATAKDINHPALHYGDIGKAFVVFGIIQGFQTVDDWTDAAAADRTTTELIVVNWMTVKRGERYIHLGRSEHLEESASDLDDHFAFIPAVEKSKVVLLAKGNSPQLGHLNEFLALAVGNYYTFNDYWCRI